MTHLPDEAFQGRTSLVSVAFPRSLASIGSSAFEECSSLSSIDLPATLTSIGNRAFYGCSALSSITLPAGLTSIGEFAFDGCSALASVTFPATLTSIGEFAFYGCSALARVTVPATATIRLAAFPPATTVLRLPPASMRDLQRDGICHSAGARWVVPLPPGATHGTTLTIARPPTAAPDEHIVQVVLAEPPLPPGSETLDVGGWQVVVTDGHAVLPEGMTHLPDEAFQGRTSLVSVAFPRSLASIGSSAFERCSALTSVTLPAGLTAIGKGAFHSCSSLPTVTLPAGLISIDDYAFASCSALTSVFFPAGFTFIGDCAFVGCSALTSVTFPAGLTCISHGVSFTIGDNAFVDSPLTRVTVPTTAAIGQEAFEPTTTVLCLPPARMRDLQRWYAAVDLVLAYKRCRPLLYGWLEKAQTELGSYGPGGAARQRDLEAFEGDFPAAALPPPPPPNAGAAAASSSSYGPDGEAPLDAGSLERMRLRGLSENAIAHAVVAQYLMEQRTSATARSSDAPPGEGGGEAVPSRPSLWAQQQYAALPSQQPASEEEDDSEEEEDESDGDESCDPWDDLTAEDWEEGPTAPVLPN